jgi:hypothetical protein
MVLPAWASGESGGLLRKTAEIQKKKITSSNFGTLPGCKRQNEVAVKVVPTSILITSFLIISASR